MAILWQHLTLWVCIGSNLARTGKQIAGVNLMHPGMVLMVRLMMTSSFAV